MNFINGQIVWFLPLVGIAIIFILIVAEGIRRRALKGNGRQQIYSTLAPRRRLFRNILFLLTVCLLGLVYARPFVGYRKVPYQVKGRDILFLFDTSKSMLATDVKPSRLLHAKWLVRQLIEQGRGDRFGLIAFAGVAFLECPLTSDIGSFEQYVDELSVDSVPVGGTNLELALQTALKAFKDGASGHRAIVLLSDGEEVSGESKRLLKELKQRNIPLFVVGIGVPGQPAIVPMTDSKNGGTKFLRDKEGNLVKTTLNAKLMQELAAVASVVYVNSTSLNSNLETIADAIDSLMPRSLEQGEKSFPNDRFYPFLLLAFLGLVIWFLLDERSRKIDFAKKTTAIFIFLGVAFGGLTAHADSELGQPDSALEENRNHDAKINKQTVDTALTNYNRAIEVQKLSPNKAINYYEKAVALAQNNPLIRAKAFQNLGVIGHREARNTVLKATQALKMQNTSESLKNLEQAKQSLDAVEEFYTRGMEFVGYCKENSSSEEQSKLSSDLAIDQQLLLNDRAHIKKLEEVIKKLQEQQKKAQKAVKSAQQQNKDSKNNPKKQQKQPKNSKENPDSKPQNSGKNKQDKQQEKNKKQQQNKTQQAQQETEQLQKQAQKLEQHKLQQQAEAATKELEKAQQEQQQQNFDQAEEHLKKALKHLQQNANKQQKKEGEQQQDSSSNKDKSKEEQQKKSKKQDKLPKPQAGKKSKPQAEQKKVDKQQAMALLKAMGENEKKVREALKARQRELYKNQAPAKDW